MLLWVLILALFGAAVAFYGTNLPDSLRANVLAVQAGIAVAFLAFIVLASNPFARIPLQPEGRGLNPVLQDPGAGLPPAVPLRRLRRPFGRLRLRRRRPDRGPHRRRLGALGAAVDARRLGMPHARHRHGLVVGLLRAGLGRLVVLGPGGERLVHAVARRHRAAALGPRDGEARGAQGLDHPARHPRLLALADRHLPGALRRAHLGARLRRRPAPRHLHPGHPGRPDRRRAGALRLARAAPQAGPAVRPPQPRGRAGAQQRAADGGLRHRLRRHALSAGAGIPHGRQDLGRPALLQRHLRPADDPAAAGRCPSARCWPGSAAISWAPCSASLAAAAVALAGSGCGLRRLLARAVAGAVRRRAGRLGGRRRRRRMGRAHQAARRPRRRQPAPRPRPAAVRLRHAAGACRSRHLRHRHRRHQRLAERDRAGPEARRARRGGGLHLRLPRRQRRAGSQLQRAARPPDRDPRGRARRRSSRPPSARSRRRARPPRKPASTPPGAATSTSCWAMRWPTAPSSCAPISIRWCG